MESGKEFRASRQKRAAWIFVALIGGLAALVALSFVFRLVSTGVYPPYYYFFGWWWIFPIFFFAMVFFGFRWWWGWGCWWGYGGRYSYYYQDSALELLRERFARGDITKEQYDQMKKDLEESR